MAYQVAVAKPNPVGVGKADTRQDRLAMLYRYVVKESLLPQSDRLR